MKIAPLIFVVFSCLVLEGEAFSDQNIDSLKGVELFAGIYNKSLRFTVKNNSDQDYMVADDFCFDAKLHTAILDLPNLKERSDSFSNGIARKQGRMMRLKSHGERTCEIGYFENSQIKYSQVTKGLVLWHTNIFIGDFNDRFSSQEFSGAIPVLFPSVESNGESPQQLIDASALGAFQMRKSLGVIE